MTGSEVKDFLEYTYSLRLDYPNEPVYNFDSAGGIRYTVDTRKPKGERIVISSMANGNHFYSTKRYHVAMSTFRALGGGTHLNKQLRWSRHKMLTRMVWTDTRDIRTQLMEFYAAQKHVQPIALTTWQYL